jgi:hypothetical protein
MNKGAHVLTCSLSSAFRPALSRLDEVFGGVERVSGT